MGCSYRRGWRRPRRAKAPWTASWAAGAARTGAAWTRANAAIAATRKTGRSRRAKKDEGQRPDGPPPQGHGPFRATALKVINLTGQPLDGTFFYRVKTGLDDYGLPVANGTHTIAAGDSFRSDPDRYRVGVLFRQPNVAGDYYADVRNVSFGYPRGGVTWGLDLNPSSGKIGGAFINEQDFAQGQVWEQGGIALERSGDSEDRIEWNLFVRPQPK